MMLFCLWLIPAQPHYDLMQAQINILANAYEAPAFEPHATLFCGQTADLEKTKKDLAQLFADQPQIQLTAKSIDHSEKYYKTLYIQFKHDDKLQKLFGKVTRQIDSQSDYHLNPHASLIYKSMTEDQKQKIADELWPTYKGKTEIQFDTVKLMSDTEDAGPNAVKSWRLLQDYKLGG